MATDYGYGYGYGKGKVKHNEILMIPRPEDEFGAGNGARGVRSLTKPGVGLGGGRIDRSTSGGRCHCIAARDSGRAQRRRCRALQPFTPLPPRSSGLTIPPSRSHSALPISAAPPANENLSTRDIFAMIDDAAAKAPLAPEPFLVRGVQARYCRRYGSRKARLPCRAMARPALDAGCLFPG